MVLLTMVGVAYLMARFVVNRLQRRFLFVSGLEYILLGVLLGPAVVNTVHVFEDMSRLAPIIAFAAGWIGLLYGMELDRRQMHESTGGAFRIALAEVGGTGFVTTLAGYLFFRSGLVIDVVPEDDALCAAAALGCAAAAGSSSAVDLLCDTYDGLKSRMLLPLLRRTSRIGDLLAIASLGLLFAYFHPGGSGDAWLETDFAGWVLITIALGVVMGLLFSTFLDNDADENHRFLALVGIIILAAGTAFFLEISALTVNLILGAWLVNSDDGPKVADTLETSLKPVTLVLMVFAGAMWVPVDPLAGLLVSAGYLLLRGAAKAGAVFLAALGTPLRKDLFRGLMAQGEAAVAIAVSFRLVYDGPAAELAYTAILISVMLNELFASRLLKGLLIDAGELDSDATAWEARA
ncbi:MAG: hypothetical protein H6737_20875 [Alphaproteobacteria bacterium]|nr:hypothetical protein [Alphaproteobacteria bacterium]